MKVISITALLHHVCRSFNAPMADRLLDSDIPFFPLLRRLMLQCCVPSWTSSIRLVLQCMLEMYKRLTPWCSKIDSEFTATFSKEGFIGRSTTFRECIYVRFLDSDTTNWFERINSFFLIEKEISGIVMDYWWKYSDCPVISDWFLLSPQTRSQDFSKAKPNLQDLKHGWPSRFSRHVSKALKQELIKAIRLGSLSIKQVPAMCFSTNLQTNMCYCICAV